MWYERLCNFFEASIFVEPGEETAAAFELLGRVESVFLFRDLVGLLSVCVDLLG